MGIFSTTFDCHDPDQLAAFWEEVLGYQVNPDRVLPGEAMITDPAGAGQTLLFIAVPEGKTVKNRLHLDLDPHGQVEAEVERVKALGATELARHQDPEDHPEGYYWIVLQDPEGNEFRIGDLLSNRA
jgi:catechol 2,3-dioxygenase-like lactoylglutathione lyase family enzyme